MTHPFEGLTPDCVVDCVEAIGLRSDLRLLALNSYENRVYQAGIEEADPVIVKFYRPGRWTREQILEEHTFAQELVDNGLSVVAPMEINGATLQEAQGFLIAAFPRRGVMRRSSTTLITCSGWVAHWGGCMAWVAQPTSRSVSITRWSAG